MGYRENVETTVRQWPWSLEERKNMGAMLAEILDHCANGTGNAFVRHWCKTNLAGDGTQVVKREAFVRECTIINGSVGRTEKADDDGAYDLLDVSGTPEAIGKSIAESLAACDLTLGGAWSYLEHGQPIWVNVTIRIDPKRPEADQPWTVDEILAREG